MSGLCFAVSALTPGIAVAAPLQMAVEEFLDLRRSGFQDEIARKELHAAANEVLKQLPSELATTDEVRSAELVGKYFLEVNDGRAGAVAWQRVVNSDVLPLPRQLGATLALSQSLAAIDKFEEATAWRLSFENNARRLVGSPGTASSNRALMDLQIELFKSPIVRSQLLAKESSLEVQRGDAVRAFQLQRESAAVLQEVLSKEITTRQPAHVETFAGHMNLDRSGLITLAIERISDSRKIAKDAALADQEINAATSDVLKLSDTYFDLEQRSGKFDDAVGSTTIGLLVEIDARPEDIVRKVEWIKDRSFPNRSLLLASRKAAGEMMLRGDAQFGIKVLQIGLSSFEDWYPDETATSHLYADSLIRLATFLREVDDILGAIQTLGKLDFQKLPAGLSSNFREIHNSLVPLSRLPPNLYLEDEILTASSEGGAEDLASSSATSNSVTNSLGLADIHAEPHARFVPHIFSTFYLAITAAILISVVVTVICLIRRFRRSG